MDQFIVAEIAKSWTNESPKENFVGQNFGIIINANLARGYELRDWKYSSCQNETVMTETIIAVFELRQKKSL